MAYDDYRCLRVRLDRGVAFVTIDHPPINLLDLALMRELDAIGKELEVDDAVRVVVFDSADPDFFIAHADVALIERLPTDVPKPTTL
ncbi:MAG: enoyl-CoA hydratase/isomerase family protein, partial [Deltaproteobacteria bacterium]